MRSSASATSLFFVLSLFLSATAGATVTATFDDLPTPPAVDSSTGLQFANGNSSNYSGALWDSRFRVTGDAYRVDTRTPGPLYGIPHSGHYFATNGGDGAGNDGLIISTPQILTGAWFGRNEYYGFGSGSDQVTIRALDGAAVLGSVVFDLPVAPAGQPGPLRFVDTSAFLALHGITGYRIDRRELGTQAGNWVADDFTFASVDEPAVVWALPGGLLMLAGLRRLRARVARA